MHNCVLQPHNYALTLLTQTGKYPWSFSNADAVGIASCKCVVTGSLLRRCKACGMAMMRVGDAIVM